MILIYTLPFLLQGIFILIDEIFYHQKRGLPVWEIWGHPLDSLSIALPFGLAAFFPPTSMAFSWYVGLAIFSCVLVTKDEVIHAKSCGAGEHWLHAVLFLLHPVSFFTAAMIWKAGTDIWALQMQFAMILVFMCYQVLYWRFRGPISQQQHL